MIINLAKYMKLDNWKKRFKNCIFCDNLTDKSWHKIGKNKKQFFYFCNSCNCQARIYTNIYGFVFENDFTIFVGDSRILIDYRGINIVDRQHNIINEITNDSKINTNKFIDKIQKLITLI